MYKKHRTYWITPPPLPKPKRKPETPSFKELIRIIDKGEKKNESL